MGDINDQRDIILALSAALVEHRIAMNKTINDMTAKLTSIADGLILPAADEADNEKPRKITKIKYDVPVGESLGGHDDGNIGPLISVIHKDTPHKLKPGKRACSICRKPGHRAQNCPDADKAYKKERGK